MSIIIFGDSFTFPDGNAATNRVHTYAKGFHENGFNVHVICFGSRYNSSGNGYSKGIYYYHPFGQRNRNKYFIIRSWHKIIKYFKTFILLIKINKQDKILFLNCWTQVLLTLFFASLLSKYFCAKIVLERSEHPLRKYQSSYLRKAKGNIISCFETLLSDGIFCISNFLIDFYKNRGVEEKKLFLVPGTVDTERFQELSISPFPFKYILYCGSLTLIKDGVNILIKSFAEISNVHPDIKLVLIGKGDSIKEESFIKDLVLTMNLRDRIIFTGQLHRNDIPVFLNNATILALARPQSLVADAGFPSKLTEYLATGIPIVVTKVGDIPIYLKDGENAFLSIPDSVEAFADKLDFVLNNYHFAKEVASEGKKLTFTVFNYNFQARRMIEFIYTLNPNASNNK